MGRPSPCCCARLAPVPRSAPWTYQEVQLPLAAPYRASRSVLRTLSHYPQANPLKTQAASDNSYYVNIVGKWLRMSGLAHLNTVGSASGGLSGQTGPWAARCSFRPHQIPHHGQVEARDCALPAILPISLNRVVPRVCARMGLPRVARADAAELRVKLTYTEHSVKPIQMQQTKQGL